MKTYDTLIIGSGYFSIGYAIGRGNTVICEEHQIVDTGFYLPLKSFEYKPYIPKSAEGKRLLEIFNSLSLFRGEQQNANAFEIAICKYLTEVDIDLLLKCRVERTGLADEGIRDVTVQTTEGLTHLYAKKIIDTVSRDGEKYITVLFVTSDLCADGEKILRAFGNASITPAFYEGRYALQLKVQDSDENLIKLEIYERWKALDTNAKILYIAPLFWRKGCANECGDSAYLNPIEAFEAGLLLAREDLL